MLSAYKWQCKHKAELEPLMQTLVLPNNWIKWWHGSKLANISLCNGFNERKLTLTACVVCVSLFFYLSFRRTLSKLNSWRYWTSGPRQQITGLSKDATLDRMREPGGHSHRNTFHRIKPQPRVTAWTQLKWPDLDWDETSLECGRNAECMTERKAHGGMGTHLSPGCGSRTLWPRSSQRQSQSERCPSSQVALCRQPER